MTAKIFPAIALLALCCVASAQTGKKSTPEERAQWAATLHRFEADPTNPGTLQEAAHAANRLNEVDDVAISPCGSFAEFPQKWNKATPVLIYLLALSAYQVGTGKNDTYGANLYAVQSVLKAYVAGTAKDASLRDKKFDRLVQMQADGKLDEMMKKDQCQ